MSETPPLKIRRLSQKIEDIILLLELPLALYLSLLLTGYGQNPVAQLLGRLLLPFTFPFHGLLPELQIGSSYYEPSAALALVAIPISGWALSIILDIWRLRHRLHSTPTPQSHA